MAWGTRDLRHWVLGPSRVVCYMSHASCSLFTPHNLHLLTAVGFYSLLSKVSVSWDLISSGSLEALAPCCLSLKALCAAVSLYWLQASTFVSVPTSKVRLAFLSNLHVVLAGVRVLWKPFACLPKRHVSLPSYF